MYAESTDDRHLKKAETQALAEKFLSLISANEETITKSFDSTPNSMLLKFLKIMIEQGSFNELYHDIKEDIIQSHHLHIEHDFIGGVNLLKKLDSLNDKGNFIKKQIYAAPSDELRQRIKEEQEEILMVLVHNSDEMDTLKKKVEIKSVMGDDIKLLPHLNNSTPEAILDTIEELRYIMDNDIMSRVDLFLDKKQKEHLAQTQKDVAEAKLSLGIWPLFADG